MKSFYFEKRNLKQVFFAFLAITLFTSANYTELVSQVVTKENTPNQNRAKETSVSTESLPATLDESYAAQSFGEAQATLLSVKQKSKGVS
jgi:hypothetical protein